MLLARKLWSAPGDRVKSASCSAGNDGRRAEGPVRLRDASGGGRESPCRGKVWRCLCRRKTAARPRLAVLPESWPRGERCRAEVRPATGQVMLRRD